MAQERTKCITLRVVKFRDEQSVTTVLTRRFGVLSFMMPDGKGREAVRRRALTMPGGVYDALVDVREGRAMQRMRDVMAVRPLLLDSPVKLTMVVFVCDFLGAVLRESLADELLYDYVEGILGYIVDEKVERLANLPITFLVGLMRFMGIEPDVADYVPGKSFDMNNGVFIYPFQLTSPPTAGRWLDVDESAIAARILRINIANMTHYVFTRDQRRRILESIIQYYSIHFGSVRSLRSLTVLHSLFD